MLSYFLHQVHPCSILFLGIFTRLPALLAELRPGQLRTPLQPAQRLAPRTDSGFAGRGVSGVWVPPPMPPALGLPSAPLGAHHLSALPTANTSVSLVEDFSPGPQAHTGGQEPPGAPQPPCPWMEPLEASLTLAASSPDGAELRCPQASLVSHSSWAPSLPHAPPCVSFAVSVKSLPWLCF